MLVLQRWDPALEAYVDETGHYLDEKGNPVVMDLKTGLVIPSAERGGNVSPPLEPQTGAEFNPGGFGEGVEVEQSITTGREPTDNSLLNGQPEGLIPPERVGDELTGFPDHSGELNTPNLAANDSNDRLGKLTVEAGKQGKRILGHNNFRPGSSEVTYPNLQELIDNFASVSAADDHAQYTWRHLRSERAENTTEIRLRRALFRRRGRGV